MSSGVSSEVGDHLAGVGPQPLAEHDEPDHGQPRRRGVSAHRRESCAAPCDRKHAATFGGLALGRVAQRSQLKALRGPEHERFAAELQRAPAALRGERDAPLDRCRATRERLR
ncbi:MAG TPA: hypothetical protein VMU39_06805, partial [Solirubrobacteraceae bacterium]|nr:hypothetical protein [Solirubrobacteraceae bacterium]